MRNDGERRVLFLTHVGDPGGAELKMIDLCRAIRGRAEVLLLQHGTLENILSESQIAASVCPMPSAARDVRKESGRGALIRAVPGVLSMIRNVARKARQFDVVVCFSQKAFVLASLAKPLMRRPIIWFMNDILSPAHFSRTLIRFLVILSRHTANRIVVNSQASLEAWLEAGGRLRGVTVIYPGIGEEMIASQMRDLKRIAHYRTLYSPDGKPLVGMFGRIGRWKGQDVFLRAIARLPEVRAIIVGGALFAEGGYEREIQGLVHELGLQNRVSFVGHVSEVMPLMAACDVVAHCSTAPEPFGLVIAEAMFAGTPVVASDAGGAREIVLPEETGQLTPLKDEAALAGAISRCIKEPTWAREMAQRATARAREKFSGSAMLAGFLSLLAAV